MTFVVGTTSITACSDEDGTSAADAEAAVCDGVADVEAAIESIGSIDPDTAEVGDLQAELDEIATVVSRLDDDRIELADERRQEITDAFDDLRADVDSIEEGDAVADVQADLQADAAAVRTAFDQVFERLDC